MCGASILVALALRLLLIRENRRLDENEEQDENVAEEDRRPAGFRYIL